MRVHLGQMRIRWRAIPERDTFRLHSLEAENLGIQLPESQRLALLLFLWIERFRNRRECLSSADVRGERAALFYGKISTDDQLTPAAGGEPRGRNHLSVYNHRDLFALPLLRERSEFLASFRVKPQAQGSDFACL